ncbi:MAG: hypothetical protein JXB38_22510 [Anaerolineales bacterium]|nr:hypothetical protein [Anaerolineales bacterium]
MQDLPVEAPKPAGGFGRLAGVLLTIISSLGIVLCLVGIVQTFKVAARMQAGVENAVQVGLDAVDTTGATLLLVDDSLSEAGDSLASLTDVLDDDLLIVLDTTEQSLAAAEEGVSVLETTLYGLSSISFGVLNYSPEVPLTESVATLSENIGEIPNSVTGLSTQLSELQANLESAQDSTAEMRTRLDGVEANLLRTQEKIARWFFIGKLVVVLLLLLVLVSQTSAVVQGIGMISGRQRALEDRLAILEARFQEMGLPSNADSNASHRDEVEKQFLNDASHRHETDSDRDEEIR